VGSALAAVNETDSTIAFLGAGETVKDIERFEPSGFISRLLGMGDLKQLHRARRGARWRDGRRRGRLGPRGHAGGQFTLKDMRKQMETMNKMGPLDQVMDMIPGLGGGLMDQLPDDAMDVTQGAHARFRIVMDSMTEEELENPASSARAERNGSRRGRANPRNGSANCSSSTSRWSRCSSSSRAWATATWSA